MASPFAVFRRNQRVMIAVCGIMAMIAFVFLDPVFRMLGGTRGPDNPLIVKTNYGNYKRSELNAVEQQRRLIEIFLEQVARARIDLEIKKIAPTENNQQMLMWANYQARRQFEATRQQLMGRVLPAGDAAAIETIILAKRAEEMGMVASDTAINDLLRTIAGDAFSQLREIISKLRADGRTLGEGYLFDGLRRELLASKYSEMFRFAMLGMPPAERLEYFERLNLKADAQVLPVKAEQFLKDVPEPNDEQLRAFFDRHSGQVQQPNSPEPGFKEPTKIEFQYFKASLDKFVEVASESVTPEEMHEYYEENKAIQFRQLGLPPATGNETPAKEGEMTDPLGPDEPAAKTDAGATEKTDAAPDAGGTDAGSGDKDKDAGKTDKKSSRVEPARTGNPFRLTSAVEKAAADKKTDAGAKSSDSDAKASDADAPANKTDAATQAPTAETPAEGADADKKTSEPKYEPFEKVEDTIRNQIARTKAKKAIKESFEKLHSRMRAFASARSSYVANKEDDPGLQEPEPLDFAALAAEFHVEARQTSLISAYEAQTETDIGKSNNGQISFLELAYLDPRPFRPEVTEDGENSYLWWATKVAPEAIPSLDDVRSKVLHAFKMIEARKLALVQADKYAKTATEAKKPLEELFKGREGLEVTSTGPFTRMTLGNTAFDPDSSLPQLSPVHAVDSAGEEFMNAVFRLKPGEVAVALNQPQDIAYVIQLEKYAPDRDLLERDFILEPFQKYGQVAAEDQHRLFLNWITNLEAEAGVEWVEQPRTDARPDEE